MQGSEHATAKQASHAFISEKEDNKHCRVRDTNPTVAEPVGGPAAGAAALKAGEEASCEQGTRQGAGSSGEKTKTRLVITSGGCLECAPAGEKLRARVSGPGQRCAAEG